jgi:hypothetical protein
MPESKSPRRAVTRLLLAVVICLPLITAPPLVFPGAANAYSSQCGTFLNRQAGWATNQNLPRQPRMYEGVGANMRVEYGNICQSDTRPGFNFSTAWDMVFSNGTPGYAQSGIMLRYGYACWLWWAEQEDRTHPFTDWYQGCATQGTTHDVWQQMLLVNGSWVVRSNVDLTVIRESSFNPIGEWSTPYQIGFSGETYYGGESDVPGYTPAPTDFSGMQIQDFNNDGWYPSCGNLILGPYVSPRYTTVALNCDHVQIWTSG